MTRHQSSGEEMSIYDAAMRYQQEGTPLCVLAGKEYGTGSSRDWAAKGTFLLGVKFVLAESYERIHRSNLVGMGVLPLQYLDGQTRESLGLTGLEAGSDIGGSIRNPAHFCGVYGHKSTYGVCSMAGHVLPGVAHPADISVIGPLARSAMDLELAFSIMAGPDAIDGAGWKLSLPKPEKKALRGWRVAVLESHPTAETDVIVQHSIRRLAQFLASKGAKVSERALPAFDLGEAHRVFIQLLRGATSGRQTPEFFEKMLAAKAQLAPKDGGYYAQMVRANVQPHKDWLIASNRRHQMRLAWAEFFKDWDVLLCPNAATAAFPHSMPGERWERMICVNGKSQPVTTQMWWAGIAGMCYLPGTAAPIGLSPEGLPLSVQVVGPQYGDLTTIRFAQLIEREYYAFAPPPAYG